MADKAYSIFDLTFSFLERFYTDSNPTKEEKEGVYKSFFHLLSQGWSTGDIIREIQKFIVRHPGVKMDIMNHFSTLRPKEENLLPPGGFFYHNALRIIPPAPKRVLDLNSGEIVKVDEEFFLEMRASFTLSDLTEYFIEKSGGVFGGHERNRIAGSLKYHLKNYSVEMILFMIDAAINYSFTEDLGKRSLNPININEYEKEAHETFGAKRTASKEEGSDQIVPRRRVLPLRGGSSDA